MSSCLYHMRRAVYLCRVPLKIVSKIFFFSKTSSVFLIHVIKEQVWVGHLAQGCVSVDCYHWGLNPEAFVWKSASLTARADYPSLLSYI